MLFKASSRNRYSMTIINWSKAVIENGNIFQNVMSFRFTEKFRVYIVINNILKRITNIQLFRYYVIKNT